MEKGEETTAEVVTTEQVEETPSMSLEDALKELETTKAELQKEATKREVAEAKASEHEKNVTRKANDLQKIQQREDRMDTLAAKMDIQAAMVAELLDRESLEEAPEPKVRRSEQYLAQLKEAEEKRTQTATNTQQQHVDLIIAEIVKLTQPKGLVFDESDELLKAYVKWTKGDIEGALEEVKKVTAESEKPGKTEAELRAELREEERKKILEERGELDTETGQSVGSSSDFRSIEQRYFKGQASVEEYEKAREKAGIR